MLVVGLTVVSTLAVAVTATLTLLRAGRPSRSSVLIADR
jgi:hypothetical protein